MDVEALRTYCIAKEAVEESFPFGPEALVFKTGGKMFLLVPLNADPLQFNAKCDPEKVVEWRERYSCVLPGYHMNKKYWNTVIIDGQLSGSQLREMIDESYRLVRKVKK